MTNYEKIKQMSIEEMAEFIVKSKKIFNVWITANGETHNLQQWADILGVTHNALENRYRRGWSDERIINIPIRKYRKVV